MGQHRDCLWGDFHSGALRIGRRLGLGALFVDCLNEDACDV
jgi:hypothetical protein